jgi:chromate transporter
MPPRESLATIAREWGCIGFGGPPAHIALLRALCVDNRTWLSAQEFEDGVATTNLLPGPASTQLAIYCAWRLRGPLGALVGGFCFIVPGLIVILALSALFLAAHPPRWVTGAAAGAGAAVPAVALGAAIGLAPASWRRLARRLGPDGSGLGPDGSGLGPDGSGLGPDGSGLGPDGSGLGPDGSGRGAAGRGRGAQVRWIGYLIAGGVAAALIGPFLVLVLTACGLTELLVTSHPWRASGPGPGEPVSSSPNPSPGRVQALLPLLATTAAPAGGLLSLAWVAFKVGALSYGGGFVIIPLMQHDAVHTYHWMTSAQFLSAVALGQITPGPVVQTVSVVGYAAAGLGGALLASLVAFTPSFAFVLAGGPRFDQLRRSARVQAFLSGAGPAAIGAIATIPLGLALSHPWQLAVLGLAAVWLIALRRGVVSTLLGAAALGVIAALAGAPVG